MGAKEVLGRIWDELERPGKQGAAEVVQLLNTGTAFVPYGEGQRGTEVEQQEAPQHGLPVEAVKQQEVQQEVQMER